MLHAHECRSCFAFEVDVGFAADIDSDPFDGAAREACGGYAGVVAGDGLAAVAADAEAFPGDQNLPGWVFMRPSPTLVSPW